MKELSRIIPNSEPVWRRNASIKKTVHQAVSKGFTDLVVINEDNRIPNGMLISHLPNGPTASFRLSNVKITKEIKVRKAQTPISHAQAFIFELSAPPPRAEVISPLALTLFFTCGRRLTGYGVIPVVSLVVGGGITFKSLS